MHTHAAANIANKSIEITARRHTTRLGGRRDAHVALGIAARAAGVHCARALPPVWGGVANASARRTRSWALHVAPTSRLNAPHAARRAALVPCCAPCRERHAVARCSAAARAGGGAGAARRRQADGLAAHHAGKRDLPRGGVQRRQHGCGALPVARSLARGGRARAHTPERAPARAPACAARRRILPAARDEPQPHAHLAGYARGASARLRRALTLTCARSRPRARSRSTRTLAHSRGVLPFIV